MGRPGEGKWGYAVVRPIFLGGGEHINLSLVAGLNAIKDGSTKVSADHWREAGVPMGIFPADGFGNLERVEEMCTGEGRL